MPVLTLPNADSNSVRAKVLVFEDPSSRALLERIQQVAPSDATVLLCGETGTGKEIVARHVHELSARRGRAFVGVNCGALPESLVESELFGHERGAFTGAVQSKVGWFETAHGGTLFLDEIGDIPLASQVKLLRVLQEGEIVRLGTRTPQRIDVRLIAATNVDLQEAVRAGRFREDLYYRLNVAPLRLAPLRERPADILPIAEQFLEQYRKRLKLEVAPRLGAAAVRALLEHSWPGNIRELENAVHHALLVGRGDTIEPADLCLTPNTRAVQRSPLSAAGPASDDALDRLFAQLFEQGRENLFEHVLERLVLSAYQHCERNQVHTARLLGISRNVLRTRLQQVGEIKTREGSLPPPSATRSVAWSATVTRSVAQSATATRSVAQSATATRSVAQSATATRGVQPPSAAKVVRIGYQRYGLLPIVKASGALERAFARQGVSVEWVEFAGGMQLLDGFDSAGLCLGLVGEVPPIFAQASHLPMVYLAAEAPAPDNEALIVPAGSQLESVEALRGKRVLLSRGSNVQYFLLLALEAARLSWADIRVVYATPERAQALFAGGQVDAWATWEPFLGRARRESGARVLRSARGLTANTSYYVGARSFVEQHPALVGTFLDQLVEVVRWAEQHSDAATALVSRALDLPPSAALVCLADARAPERFDTTHLRAQQNIADTFQRLGLVDERVDVARACWPNAPIAPADVAESARSAL